MARSDDRDGFAPFAGAVWPRNRDELTSTDRCPACFTLLTSAVCGRCGLDLATPVSAELLAASIAAAGAMDDRIALIGRIRHEADAPARAAAEVQAAGSFVPPGPTAREQLDPASLGGTVVSRAAPVGASAPVHSTAPTAQRERSLLPQASVPGAETATPPRRGSSVQVILLIVGVSLLSVGAIFFLVYAFINYGILWRSVIIAAITISAFAVATLLARRRSRATAEGIATFAVVLIYLDAFAVRENDFFGAASVDGLLYWGATIVLAAVGLIGWHRRSLLRVPSVIGFASLPIGIGLIVGALSEPLADYERTYLAFIAMALAALVHRLAPRSTPPTAVDTADVKPFEGLVERSLLLGTATFSIAIAAIATVAFPLDLLTAEVLALVGVAAIAATHVTVLLRRPPRGVRAWTALFSVAAGVALSVLGFVLTLDSGGISPLVIWPAIVATTTALAFELLGQRFGARSARLTLRFAAVTAAWAAGAVAALALLVPLLVSGERAATFLARGLVFTLGRAADDRMLGREDWHALSIVALVVCVALASAAWRVGRRLRSRAALVGWAAAAVLTLAVPLLDVLWIATSGWFVLGITALIILLKMGRSDLVEAVRLPLIGLLVGSTTCGWIAAWAGVWIWLPAAFVAVAILLASRALAPSGARGAMWRAVLAGLAAVLVLFDTGFVPTLLLPGEPVADGVRFVLAASVLLLLASAVDLRRIADATDRRVLFWISFGAAATMAVAASAAGDADLLPDPVGALVLAAGLLVALVAVVASPDTRELPIERVAAAIAVGPTLALLLDAFARTLDAPQLVASVAPITAALLASAGSLAVTLLRPSSVPRGLREIGVGIVAVPAVVGSGLLPDGSTWLTLLLAGVVALLLAISRDGLFTSASPRKHFGWLALALVVAGLWWRLGDDSVQEVEPYVLPVAGLLLLVALLIWRSDRHRMPTPASTPSESGLTAGGGVSTAARRATPSALVALAGLLVAVLPIAAAAAADGRAPGEAPVRAIAVGAMSAILLLIGAFLPSRPAAVRPFLDVAALAGAAGVVVTAVGRAVVIAAERPSSGELDAWLAAAFVLLVVAAFGLASRERDALSAGRDAAGLVLAVIALTAVTAVESWVLSRTDGSVLRPVTVVVLFCAVHLVAFLVDRAPLTRAVAWIAIGYAAFAASVAVAAESLDPLELGSVPIAIALIATGVTRLDADREARSWPWLAPGVAVLLVPSLFATIDDRPLWRLVGIGVAGVVVIVVSVTRRLQAPFAIAAVVLLIHALATFAPQVRMVYESVEWWLWLAIGGIVLIALAARYEQRMQNLKNAVGRYSTLR